MAQFAEGQKMQDGVFVSVRRPSVRRFRLRSFLGHSRRARALHEGQLASRVVLSLPRASFLPPRKLEMKRTGGGIR